MNRTYIIAEIGINHNGSLENCYKLIDAAKSAGCDAAKFQTFTAGKMYPKSAGRLDWKDNNGSYNYDIYNTVKSFEIPLNWITSLISYCTTTNIDFISSVFDSESLMHLLNNGMRKIKIPSYLITNTPLIEECAKSNLPIIMSTGGATLGETEEAVNTVLKYHDNLALLHCSIQYPTKLKDCNLGVIKTLKYAFPGIEIGYSDHTSEVSTAAVQSIYLGGSVVEKHITLDKNMDGPDHFFALEPHELSQMVTNIRNGELDYQKGDYSIDSTIYGNTAKLCHTHEQYLRDFAFMGLFSKRYIKKGYVINPEDIVILRPGKKQRGLDPRYLELFNKYHISSNEDLKPEDPILWDSIFTLRA